jgi:hypothetical protein
MQRATVKSREAGEHEAQVLTTLAIIAVAVLIPFYLLTVGSPRAQSARLGPPVRPDPRLTPGATLEGTVSDICEPGYTKKVRDVPKAVKQQVYKAYGIQNPAPRTYEVDHLIPLALGGSNRIENLWPQATQTQPWNAQHKDRLENTLRRLVCSQQLPLDTAQRAIAIDWTAAYCTYVRDGAAGACTAGSSGKP